jgi:signal peptidase I
MTAGLVVAVVLSALCTAGVAVLRRRYVSVHVTGGSMRPTYDDGDRVLVRRMRRFRTGDVVVVAQPGVEGGWLIKRLVAQPGDPVPRDRIPALATVAEENVPAGSVVVLGDGGPHSLDSKQLGYLPMASILGVAVRTLGR